MSSLLSGSHSSTISRRSIYYNIIAMLNKDGHDRRRTSPESSQTGTKSLYSSQALLSLINKKDLHQDKMFRASPAINSQQPERRTNQPTDTRKQWNSPPKKFPDKLETKYAHQPTKSTTKFSPQSLRCVQNSQQKGRLSFKKSSPKHTRTSTDNRKEELENEVVLSLREIKRLRQVIQTLVRDNKKLKRIAHEILEGRFSEWTEFNELESNRYYQQPAVEDRLRLNTSIKSNASYNSSLSSSSNNIEVLESYKQENKQLNEQVGVLRRLVESLTTSKGNLQREIEHLAQSVCRYQVTNKQLAQENTNLQRQYTYCSNRILELEDKIAQVQVLNQSDMRFSKWTVESRYLDDLSRNDSQISIVQHKIPSGGSEDSVTKLEFLLQTQQLNHKYQLSRVCSNYENMITELINSKCRREDKKLQKNDQSINTKQSQTATSSVDIVESMRKKKELQYQMIGLILRMANKQV